MISLGVIATGLVGGGPTPEPPNGNLRLFAELPVHSAYSAVEDYDLPGLAPSINILTGTCTEIYQSYRVVEGGDELASLVVKLVNGDYAICYDQDGYGIYITPCNVNESIVPDLATWEATCTLYSGVTVAKIDLGQGAAHHGLTIIEEGKIVLHPVNMTDTPERAITVNIITYSNPTDADVLPVEINLDTLGIDAQFYFLPTRGCNGAAIDYTSGQLVMGFSVIDNSESEYLSFTVNVDHVTGVLSNLLLSTNSCLRGLDEITDNGFENGPSSFFDSVTDGYISSYGSIGNTIAANDYRKGLQTLDTWTYTERLLSSDGYYSTEYEGLHNNFTFNRNTVVNDKLVALGFTIASGVSISGALNCYAVIE